MNNMSWCKPLISKDGRTAVAINEGDIVGLMIDGKEVGSWKGYSLSDEIFDDLEEGDCEDCPWYDGCEAFR